MKINCAVFRDVTASVDNVVNRHLLGLLVYPENVSNEFNRKFGIAIPN